MQTIKVEILSWKKTILIAMWIAIVHPLIYGVFGFFKGQSFAESAWIFIGVFAVYLAFEALSIGYKVFVGTLWQIVADETGLQFKAGKKSQRLAWTQISILERSTQAEGAELKTRLTLRDAGGQELAHFLRNSQETRQLKAQFDQLEALIVQKIGRRGLIEAPLGMALRQTAFVLQMRQKIIGFVGMAVTLPCSLLSWNHPTGGAFVGGGFLAFSLVSAFLVFSDSRYEIDEHSVRCQTLFKKTQLRWEEIEKAEMMRSGTSISFSGSKTAITILGPASWGNDGAQLMLFVQRQIEKFGILWDGDRTLRWSDFRAEPKKP
ncbi:MAG TPA: hypothetical protein VF627_13280 [Abditibacterium sp.]|jgi:hypothetical protein